MFTLDGQRPREAFGWAFLCGLLFFGATLFWFFHLTKWFSYIAAVGALLLFFYLALYFGLFAFGYVLFSRHRLSQRLVIQPSVWVVLEYIRGHLFTGFDWASLGHSQYGNLCLIQIADITGVYGVSFILVMGNIFIKEMIPLWERKPSLQKKAKLVLILSMLVIFSSVLGYGAYHLRQAQKQGQENTTIPVAVIQVNIPQEDKWDLRAWQGIMDSYLAISEQAAKQRPALLVWPETSYPAYLWENKAYFEKLQAFVRKIKIPLLFGAVLKEGEVYYNAAFLLSEEGEVVEIYRKIHLVPFGEYLPLRSMIPFLDHLVDIGDFTAGKKWTTFSFPVAPAGQRRTGIFSVLICFEDTVARLSRQFVGRGAQLLVNITNDAWFGDTHAPWMHLQSSVFRTIENRRDLARAANTGVSCFIDRWGRIRKYVQEGEGGKAKKTYISGYAIAPVEFNDQITFYTKFGDIFAILCFGCILWGIITGKNPSMFAIDIFQ